MKDILCEDYLGPRLPPKVQMERNRRVKEQELTQQQRELMLAYYFQDMTIPQIAAQRGVQKSSISRCLKRAENRVRRCLRY